MTWPPRRTQILCYLQWLQTALRLDEWQVRLSPTPAEDGTEAQVVPTEDSRVATVFLHPTFLDRTPQEIRQTLIHELLHLHHQEIERILVELQVSLSLQEHKLATNLHHHACEVMVDQLAYAIADLLERTGIDKAKLARIKP